jgi:hypothetical protein
MSPMAPAFRRHITISEDYVLLPSSGVRNKLGKKLVVSFSSYFMLLSCLMCSSTLKMGAVNSSEMSMNLHQTI